MTAVQQSTTSRLNGGGLIENNTNGKHFKQQQSSESGATAVTQATSAFIVNNRRRIISEGTSIDATTTRSSNTSDAAATASVVLINSQRSAPAAICRASSSFDSGAREEPLYIYAADFTNMMVQRHETWLAEDICFEASRNFKLTPLASYLFALRDVSGVSGGGEWLPPSFNFRKQPDEDDVDGDDEDGQRTPSGENASSSVQQLNGSVNDDIQQHNNSLKVNGHTGGLVGRSISSTSPTNEDDIDAAVHHRKNNTRTPKRVSSTTPNITDVEFRMRFFPSSLTELALIDRGAMRLLFFQIRNDLLCPHSDLAQALVQKEPSVVRGLAVLDMIREMKEQSKSASEVIRDWEQYLPRNALKIQAKSIVKKLVANSILQAKTLQEVLAKRALMYDTMSPSEVMEQYIRFFLQHCPQYLSEMFFIERACVGFGEALTASGMSGAPLEADPVVAESPSLLTKFSHHKQQKSTTTTINKSSDSEHTSPYVSAANDDTHAREQYWSSSVTAKITTAHDSESTSDTASCKHATGRTSASPTPNKIKKLDNDPSSGRKTHASSEANEVACGSLSHSHSVASFHGYNTAQTVAGSSARDNACSGSVGGGADARPTPADDAVKHRQKHLNPFSSKKWKNLISVDKTSTSSSVSTFSDSVSTSRRPSDINTSTTLHILASDSNNSHMPTNDSSTLPSNISAEQPSDSFDGDNSEEQHRLAKPRHHHRKFLHFDLHHHSRLLHGGGGGRSSKHGSSLPPLPPLPPSLRKHDPSGLDPQIVTKNYVSVVFYIDWASCNNNPSSNLDTSIGFGPVLRISVTAFRYLRNFGDDNVLPPAPSHWAVNNAAAAAACATNPMLQQQHSTSTTTKSVRKSPQQHSMQENTSTKADAVIPLPPPPPPTAPVILSHAGLPTRRNGGFARSISTRPIFSSSVSTPPHSITVNSSSCVSSSTTADAGRNSGGERRNTTAAVSSSGAIIPPFPMFRRSTSNTSNTNISEAAVPQHTPPVGGGCGLFTSSVNGRAARHLMRLQTSKRQWFDHFQTVATIDELCDISVLYRLNQVQVNRMNGPPVFLTFASRWQMDSFVALIDGYHRLAHRFFFNLCKELPNPSLQRLKTLRCHGPVDRQFTYAKLRLRNVGAYMLCQSSEQYDAYRLDVKASDGAVKSYLIEKQPIDGVSSTNTNGNNDDDGCYYTFWGSREKFATLQALLAHYCRPQSSSTAVALESTAATPAIKRPPALQLSMCIPPIENDPACLPLFIANDFVTMPPNVGGDSSNMNNQSNSSSTSHMNITSSRIRRDSTSKHDTQNSPTENSRSGAGGGAAASNSSSSSDRLPTLQAAEINSNLYQPLCGSFTCVTRCAWRLAAQHQQQLSQATSSANANYDGGGSVRATNNYGRMPHARLLRNDPNDDAGITEREVALKTLGKGVAVALGMMPYPKQLMNMDETPRKSFRHPKFVPDTDADNNSESSSAAGIAKLAPQMHPNRTDMPIDARRAVSVLNDFMLAQQLVSTRTLLTGNNTQGVLADIYGVMLSPLALVMEYFPMGNVRDMLLNTPTRDAITVMHALEAAACVAKAIWFLEERLLAHGNVRGRNVFVKAFSRQRPWHLAVKLGDPGLLTQHDDAVHWRPLEAHVTTARQCLLLPQQQQPTTTTTTTDAQKVQSPARISFITNTTANTATTDGETDELPNSTHTSSAFSRQTSSINKHDSSTTSLESFSKAIMVGACAAEDAVDGRVTGEANELATGSAVAGNRRFVGVSGGGIISLGAMDKTPSKNKTSKISSAKIPFEALVATATTPSAHQKLLEKQNSSPSDRSDSMSRARLLDDSNDQLHYGGGSANGNESQYIVESSVRSSMTAMTTVTNATAAEGGYTVEPRHATMPVIFDDADNGDEEDDDDDNDDDESDESDDDDNGDECDGKIRMPSPNRSPAISSDAVDILIVKEGAAAEAPYVVDSIPDSVGSSTLKAHSPDRPPSSSNQYNRVVVTAHGVGGSITPITPAPKAHARIPLAALTAVLSTKPVPVDENNNKHLPASNDEPKADEIEKRSTENAVETSPSSAAATSDTSSSAFQPPTFQYLTPIINSQLTDSWAYATFLWEVFTLGETPCPYMTPEQAEAYYRQGRRLPKPTACPAGVYEEVMWVCWAGDPGARKMPQEIMRDINQFYSQHYLSDPGLTTLVELQARHSNLPYYEYHKFQAEPKKDEITPVKRRLHRRGGAAGDDAVHHQQQPNVCALPQNVILQQIAMNPVMKKPERHAESQYVAEKPPRTTAPINQSRVVFESRTVFGVTNPVKHEYTVRDAVPVAGMPAPTSHSNSDNQFSMNPESARAGLGPLQYDPWIIEESDLTLLEYLGEGRYGHVQKALLRDPFGATNSMTGQQEGRIVAVKQLKAAAGARFQGVELDDEVRQELDIMKNLRHNRIVEIIGLCLGRTPRLVMEYINGGTLLGYLQRYAKYETSVLNDAKLLNFACDVADGMQYLHSMNVVHRDLAARNVLVSDGGQHAKISDFGLARFVGSDQYYVASRQRDIPAAWYAPEVLERNRYSCESDVWSYGILLWELFSLGASPNTWSKPLNTLIDRLQQGARLPCPDRCPTRIYNDLMINGCWQYKKDLRLSMERIISMLDSYKQDAVNGVLKEPPAAAPTIAALESTTK